MSIIVGIDLGTTYSAIAYVNQYGKPEVIANREGSRITPSVVLFDHEGPIVGEIAKRSAVAQPFDVVQFVKRQIGDKSWQFTTNSGVSFSPEEISAIILKRLKEDAETMLNQTIKDVVITVPAYFDDSQRKATQDAGKIAGLNVIRVINEPTAAALSYGLDKMNVDRTLLVYDLGGGTFDVTVMQLGATGVKVLATGGAKNLGGCDWDNIIMNYLNEEFQKCGGVDLLEDPMLEQDLREKAEIAKKTLSSREKTHVFISANGMNTSVILTRKKFEELTQPLLNKTQKIMEFVMEDAGLTWPDLDRVLLVGGSTRMKSVCELLEKVTSSKPFADVNPDEVVALGAAIQGALLNMNYTKNTLLPGIEFPNIEIQDVNSHSLGVVALNHEGEEINAIVLPKDTVTSTKVSGNFLTTVDHQKHLHIQVTEGEYTDLDYIRIVGEGMVDLPDYPKGTPIEVIFQHDLNGIINLSIVNPMNGKILGEFNIGRVDNLTEEEIVKKRDQLDLLSIG